MSLLKSKSSTNKSASLSSNSTTTMPKSKSKTLKSETAKSLLNNTSLENVEIEYIKNLQQQVYFLEMECNYLRQQLNSNSVQGTLRQQDDKNQTTTSISEKDNLFQLLEQTERNFHKERELLLKEMATLKKQKIDLEESLINKSVELTKTQENLEKHHITTHHSVHHATKIESQLEHLRKDNQLLRTEINDARTKLISRDNLIKDLQDQLNNDPKRVKQNLNEELKNTLSTMTNKLTMTNEALTKEAVLTQQLTEENLHLKSEVEVYNKKLKELTKENDRLSSLVESSLKQNEADLLLAKKNAEHSKTSIEKLTSDLESEKSLNNNFKAQIEQLKLTEKLEIKSNQSLKSRIRELEESISNSANVHNNSVKSLQDQLKTKHFELDQEKLNFSNELNTLQAHNKSLEQKVNHLNETIETLNANHKLNNEALKTKHNDLQAHLDEKILTLDNEKNNNKNLQLTIDNYKRQEEIHSNLIASLKVRVNELDAQLNDLPNLLSQLKETDSKLQNSETEKQSHLTEIHLLKQKIESLKNLEAILKSQKWSEFGQLAESMKSISLTIVNDH